EHRDEIDELDSWIYPTVNNGVYRSGFAAEQGAYEQAYDELWASLDRLEERLTTRRYLAGDPITVPDIRLFTTLVRFDAVYHGHFKAKRN
ncbi:glutathione S-transferase C-terminal domain-containing protein, partial [Escherichia coli]|uniref:glutathione S-transferase C-terminal domain-containing protein n=1 Tax=Escherichia coli TaxID=562 RepID=UPI0028DF8748